MSLLIEGMKMPEYRDVYGDGQNKCVYFLMLTVNKDGVAYLQFNDVEGGFYQVKEVPSPHGRLIDADELLRRPTGILFNKYPKSCVRNAPTIIEAEASE